MMIFSTCLDLLEESPFLTKVMPWGPLSHLSSTHRSKSDDGPILWVRPGEQLIPTAETCTPSKKRKRYARISFCLLSAGGSNIHNSYVILLCLMSFNYTAMKDMQFLMLKCLSLQLPMYFSFVIFNK